MSRQPCVYILTNRHHTVLYTGVTSNLARRIDQHQSKAVGGFTKRNNVDKLVYYEVHGQMEEAIMREEQIKAGSRAKKMALVNSLNPDWRDLATDL